MTLMPTATGAAGGVGGNHGRGGEGVPEVQAGVVHRGDVVCAQRRVLDGHETRVEAGQVPGLYRRGRAVIRYYYLLPL